MSDYKTAIDRTERLASKVTQYTNQVTRELNRDSNINISSLSEVYSAIRKAKDNRYEIGDSISIENVKMDTEATEIWGKTDFESNNRPKDMCIDEYGYVYLLQKELCKIAPNGNISWTKNISLTWIVYAKGYVYGGYSDTLYKIDRNGNVIEKIKLEESLHSAISDSKYLYGKDGSYVCKLSFSGSLLHKTKFNDFIEDLCFDKNGNIYCITSKNVGMISTDGAKRWSKEVSGGQGIATDDKYIYYTNQSTLYVCTLNGDNVEQRIIVGQTKGMLMMDNKKNIYMYLNQYPNTVIKTTRDGIRICLFNVGSDYSDGFTIYTNDDYIYVKKPDLCKKYRNPTGNLKILA